MQSRAVTIVGVTAVLFLCSGCKPAASAPTPAPPPAPITLTGTLTTGVAGGWILARPNDTPVNLDISAVQSAAQAAQLKPVTVTGTYNAQGTLVLTGLK